MPASTTLDRPTSYKAPPAPMGQQATTVYPDWADDEPVVIHFVYEPAEPRTWDDPGEPEVFDLTAVFVRGWDCFPLLSEAQIEALETLIRESAQ